MENEGKRAANLGLVGFQRAPKFGPWEIGTGEIGPWNSQGSLWEFGLPKKALGIITSRRGRGEHRSSRTVGFYLNVAVARLFSVLAVTGFFCGSLFLLLSFPLRSCPPDCVLVCCSDM